ncbi:unnamed protein product [Lampetra fluviatilis]
MLTTRSPVLFIFAVFLSLVICYVYYKSPTFQCGAPEAARRAQLGAQRLGGGRAVSVSMHAPARIALEVRRRGEATTVDGEQQIAGFNEQSVVEKILKVRDCPSLENRTEIDAFQ